VYEYEYICKHVYIYIRVRVNMNIYVHIYIYTYVCARIIYMGCVGGLERGSIAPCMCIYVHEYV